MNKMPRPKAARAENMSRQRQRGRKKEEKINIKNTANRATEAQRGPDKEDGQSGHRKR